jgi:hypothetical protein
MCAFLAFGNPEVITPRELVSRYYDGAERLERRERSNSFSQRVHGLKALAIYFEL